MVTTMAERGAAPPGSISLADSRRRLLLDSLGIMVSASGFGRPALGYAHTYVSAMPEISSM